MSDDEPILDAPDLTELEPAECEWVERQVRETVTPETWWLSQCPPEPLGLPER